MEAVERVISYYNEKQIHSLQILTIIFGIIDVAITADSFNPWPDEEFFLAIAILSLLFSLAVWIGSKVYVSETTKVIDMTINLVLGAILVISSIVMLVSAIRFEKNVTAARIAERAFAAILGFGNGVIFGFIGILMLQELQNSIFPIEIKQNKLVVFDWDRINGNKYTGKLQALVIVLGAIDLGLTAHSYYRRSEEGLFLTIVATCFIVSVIELVGALLGFIKTNDSSNYIVLSITHCIAAVLLVSGGILMIVATTTKNLALETCNSVACSFGSYDERLVCGILGIVNAILYGAIAYCWYLRSKNVNKVNQFEWDYEDLEPLIPTVPENVSQENVS